MQYRHRPQQSHSLNADDYLDLNFFGSGGRDRDKSSASRLSKSCRSSSSYSEANEKKSPISPPKRKGPKPDYSKIYDSNYECGGGNKNSSVLYGGFSAMQQLIMTGAARHTQSNQSKKSDESGAGGTGCMELHSDIDGFRDDGIASSSPTLVPSSGQTSLDRRVGTAESNNIGKEVDDVDLYFTELFGESQHYGGGRRTTPSRKIASTRGKRRLQQTLKSWFRGDPDEYPSSTSVLDAARRTGNNSGDSAAIAAGVPSSAMVRLRKAVAARRKRMIHVGEGIAVFMFICLVYSGLQLSSVSKFNRQHMHNIRHVEDRFGAAYDINRKKKKYRPELSSGAFEEGMDRPNSEAYLRLAQNKWAVGKGRRPQNREHRARGREDVGSDGKNPPREPQSSIKRSDSNTEEKLSFTGKTLFGGGEQARPNTLSAVPEPKLRESSVNDSGLRDTSGGNDLAGGEKVSKSVKTLDENVLIPGEVQGNADAGGNSSAQMKRATGEKQPERAPSPFVNLAAFPSAGRPGDKAFLWHVPLAGGSSFVDILGGCMGMTIANEMGANRANGQALEVFESKGGSRFLNVDMYSPTGIERAKSLNVAGSGLVDVIVTPYLYEASTLFSQNHRGRVFTVLRDPVDRAVSMFGAKIRADPTLASMSVEDYAKSNRVENNWMTRFLANARGGALTSEHLERAKEVLREKFLIGLYDSQEATMERFRKYFGWSVANKDNPKGRRECIGKLLAGHRKDEQILDKVEQGTRAYSALLWQNQYDMKLYKFAVKLFEEQSHLFKEKA